MMKALRPVERGPYTNWFCNPGFLRRLDLKKMRRLTSLAL